MSEGITDYYPTYIYRYNITIQDIKLCNKIWTNEGLWPGRVLRIPVLEVASRILCLCGQKYLMLQAGAGAGLDLSGSETMSTDSQLSGAASGLSSEAGSRRLSNNDSGTVQCSTVQYSTVQYSTVRLPHLHNVPVLADLRPVPHRVLRRTLLSSRTK